MKKGRILWALIEATDELAYLHAKVDTLKRMIDRTETRALENNIRGGLEEPLNQKIEIDTEEIREIFEWPVCRDVSEIREEYIKERVKQRAEQMENKEEEEESDSEDEAKEEPPAGPDLEEAADRILAMGTADEEDKRETRNRRIIEAHKMGMSNKDIAKAMGCSPATVSLVLRKWKVGN